MEKLFLFALLARLVLSSNSASQYFESFDVVRFYRRFLADPNQQTFDNFVDHIKKFCDQSPIDCFKLLERYRYNSTFRDIFWRALLIPINIDPSIIISGVGFPDTMLLVSTKIRTLFSNCSCFDELSFKNDLQVLSLLVRTVEKDYSALKPRGINGWPIDGLEDRIAIWKFLIKNISFDFTCKTINYYSLFRTFCEIRSIIKMDHFDDDFPRLAKLCSLLWFYLDRIYRTNCNAIFDLHDNHKPLIISLVINVGNWNHNFSPHEEFNSIRLANYLKELYKTDLMHLNLISGFRLENMPRSYCRLLKAPYKISSFSELIYFLKDKEISPSRYLVWKIRALAELELYLSRNGKRINQSHSSSIR